MTGLEMIVFILLVLGGTILFVYPLYAITRSSRQKDLVLHAENMKRFREEVEYLYAHRHCLPCPYKRR